FYARLPLLHVVLVDRGAVLARDVAVDARLRDPEREREAALLLREGPGDHVALGGSVVADDRFGVHARSVAWSAWSRSSGARRRALTRSRAGTSTTTGGRSSRGAPSARRGSARSPRATSRTASSRTSTSRPLSGRTRSASRSSGRASSPVKGRATSEPRRTTRS